jgi:hypothetical protein
MSASTDATTDNLGLCAIAKIRNMHQHARKGDAAYARFDYVPVVHASVDYLFQQFCGCSG